MDVDKDAEVGGAGGARVSSTVNDITSRVQTSVPAPTAGNPEAALNAKSTFKRKGIVVRTRVNGGGNGYAGGPGAGGGDPHAEGDSGSDQWSPSSPASAASSSPKHGGRDKQSLTKKLVSRVRELKDLFGLDVEDDTEELLDTFMCALKKRILLQGRMYVFTKHVCFSCSLFGYHKIKSIPIESILSVRKMKHVGFPNSVEILWREHIGDEDAKREFFTSFLSREEAFRLILGQWDPYQGQNDATGRRGRKEADRTAVNGSRESNDLNASNESNYRSRSLSRGSSMEGMPRSRPSTADSRGQASSSASTAKLPDSSNRHGSSSTIDPILGEARHEELLSAMDRTQSAGEILTPRATGQVTDFSPSIDLGDKFGDSPDAPPQKLESAPEVPPIMQKVMEYVIPIHPQEFYDLFLSSKSEFFIDYHAAQGHKSIELSAWDYHGSMGPVRDLSFVTALKGFRIGPPEALCHQTQRVGVYAGSHIVFETSQVMSDIPYGDHFKVETRWDVFPSTEASDVPSGVGNPESSKMIIHIAVPFTKNTMFKKFIEKGVTDSLLEAYQMFKRLAAQKLEAAENDADQAMDGVSSTLSIRSSRSVRSDTLPQKPHHPEDLLPQQEEDWEMMLDRVEPNFRSGLASLRKMQQEVARQNKFSLTKSKHRRNTSIIDADALDAIISDFEGDTDDVDAGKGPGGSRSRRPDDHQANDRAVTTSNAACKKQRTQRISLPWFPGSLELDARDRTYLSLIVVLLAVVVAQSAVLLLR